MTLSQVSHIRFAYQIFTLRLIIAKLHLLSSNENRFMIEVHHNMKICIKRLRSTDLTGSSREQHKGATVKSCPVKAPFLFERNANFCQMGKMTPGNNYF